MRLEDEIRQSKFPNEFEKALVNVLFTSNHFYSVNLKRFKSYGLSPEQYNVLRILRGSQPKCMRLSDISERMLDRNSNATRLVEKLRLKNMITRESCPSDRRQVDIAITDKGLDVLSQIDIESAEWYEANKNLTKEEAETLNFLLDKMRG